MEKKICSICGNEINGFGNNPQPYDMTPGAVCCDNCNMDHVIPARMARIHQTIHGNPQIRPYA